METVGNTVETFLGTTFRIASNNREIYRQEIITGLEGCLLDLIDQSIATNSALCVAFLAALIDTSASTHALGQYALTESVNNFQVRHRIVFSALDLIYLFDLITGRRRSAHQQRCAGIRSRAECASLEAIIDAQFGWRI